MSLTMSPLNVYRTSSYKQVTTGMLQTKDIPEGAEGIVMGRTCNPRDTAAEVIVLRVYSPLAKEVMLTGGTAPTVTGTGSNSTCE